VKQRARAIAGAVACFALGVVAQRTYDALRAGELQFATRRVATPKPIWTPAQVERSHVDYSKQPLWAWGVTQAPGSDEKQAVQFAPGTRTGGGQNANLSPEELNRKRHVEGSPIEMSLSLAPVSTGRLGANSGISMPKASPSRLP
jgi:hypothetical protein